LKKLILSALFASFLDVEKKIYKTIFDALFPSKSVVKVWSDEPSKIPLFASIERVEIVKDKENADILMLCRNQNIDIDNKKIFTNGYLVFQRNKGKAVGGFYWQKGRPNLIFAKKKLEKEGIELPSNLRKYIEDIE